MWISRTPRANSISGIQICPSISIGVASSSGTCQPARETVKPARVAMKMGIRNRPSSEARLSRIFTPTLKCRVFSMMNSTTAAGSIFSPKASSISGRPMLPELLNIIGGPKVLKE